MKYIKTELGQRAFKERSADLSARQRAAFILMDGKRSASDVLQATGGLGVTEADITQMLAHGFLAESATGPSPATPAGAMASAPRPPASVTSATSLLPPATAEVSPSPPSEATTASTQERYLRAYPIATRLTAAMGLRGFRLNLAVESAAGYQQLLELLPRIREAVGQAKCQPLEDALGP